MARARNIKPGFFANENLAECDPLARIMFAGLWCLADREGRLEDRPKRIRAELLPYDACDADDLLGQLQEHGFVLRYELGGQRYIQVLNFCKHQNPHVKEAKSTIPAPAGNEPAPDEHSASTVHAPDEHQKSPADSLIPDSLIPESPLTPQGEATADAEAESVAPAEQDGEGEVEPDPVQPALPEVGAEAEVETPDAMAGFDAFWAGYPRKTAKQAAQKAWAKLKPDAALIASIAESLAKHRMSRDWLKDNGQFIPHPASWLNGRRWEDEVKPASNVHQFPQSRHTGFDDRDYTDGLTMREDGTYAF